MKKFNYVIVMLITFMAFSTVYAADLQSCIDAHTNDLACGSVYFIPQELPFFTNLLINLIKIFTPIILIIKGLIDIFKATTGNSEKDIEKARTKFFKRLIPALSVFLIILVVQFVFDMIATEDESTTFTLCTNCFLNNDCEKTSQEKINNYCVELYNGSTNPGGGSGGQDGGAGGQGSGGSQDIGGGQGGDGGSTGTENLSEWCISKKLNCGTHKENGVSHKCFVEKGSDYRDTVSETNKCRTDTIYQGKKYNLTDQQKRKLAGMIIGEYGADEAGMKAVASQMANNYEKYRYLYKKCATTRTLYEYVINSEKGCLHYATYNKPESSNATALKVVEDVIVNGNRTLPLYVDEFDMFPNDINTFGEVRKKSSQYVQGVTEVNGCYGGKGIFWCMAQNPGDANLHYYTKEYKEFVESGKLDKAISEDKTNQ